MHQSSDSFSPFLFIEVRGSFKHFVWFADEVKRNQLHEVPVSGKKEGIFMQIGIKDDNQGTLRFLWPTNREFKEHQYTRTVFGAKCSPSIAIFLLQQGGIDFCNKKPNLLHLVHGRFCVDRSARSHDKLLDAQKYSKNSENLCL